MDCYNGHVKVQCKLCICRVQSIPLSQNVRLKGSWPCGRLRSVRALQSNNLISVWIRRSASVFLMRKANYIIDRHVELCTYYTDLAQCGSVQTKHSTLSSILPPCSIEHECTTTLLAQQHCGHSRLYQGQSGHAWHPCAPGAWPHPLCSPAQSAPQFACYHVQSASLVDHPF